MVYVNKCDVSSESNVVVWKSFVMCNNRNLLVLNNYSWSSCICNYFLFKIKYFLKEWSHEKNPFFENQKFEFSVSSLICSNYSVLKNIIL